MNSIAIIPARSGSKRIKNKNIKDFFGQPIINYSIKNAFKTNLFSKIHISTDSIKIKKIVEKNNLKIDFMRPARLGKDNTSTFKVIKYVLNKYKENNILFDNVCLLTACSPLIFYKDILKAYKLFNKYKRKKSVISVGEFEVPIEWAYKPTGKYLIKPMNFNATLRNSQSFKKKYYDTGSFVIYPADLFYKYDLNKIKEYLGYILPKTRAVDIDNLEDWKMAEILYKYNKQNGNLY